MLIGGSANSGMPPGAKIIGAERVGPGPQIDGQNSQQIVFTNVKNGLLFDCIAQSKQDKAEMDYGFQNFVKACMHNGD